MCSFRCRGLHISTAIKTWDWIPKSLGGGVKKKVSSYESRNGNNSYLNAVMFLCQQYQMRMEVCRYIFGSSPNKSLNESHVVIVIH